MTGFVPGPGVGFVVEAGDVYVARLPDGPILQLTDTAALIWEAALAGPRQTLVMRLAELVAAEPANISGDVMDFIDRLTREGLIRPAPVGDTEPIG
ncbi:PqqD family protein [Microbacterium atlanticum]|uniref:PqqD family protein n=1 Tax=Microbacterium atlanticum TaxID=2782168 RepID=UPI001888704C|nr:PqqD family protein [Microbacterium atlanticum]